MTIKDSCTRPISTNKNIITYCCWNRYIWWHNYISEGFKRIIKNNFLLFLLNSRRGHEVGKPKEGLLFLSFNLFSHIYIYKVRLLCPLIYSFMRRLGSHIVPISSALIGGGWSYKQWLKTSKLWLVNLSKLDAALTVSTVHACCCCCWSFVPSLSSFTHHKNNCITASWSIHCSPVYDHEHISRIIIPFIWSHKDISSLCLQLAVSIRRKESMEHINRTKCSVIISLLQQWSFTQQWHSGA